MSRSLLIALSCLVQAGRALAGPYSPAPAYDGEPANGSTAVAADDVRIKGWATGVFNFAPGPRQIGSSTADQVANFGVPENALGRADASLDDAFPVVSLGDGGSITLTFSQPLADGPGADLAVFENAFNDTFLELAFVEVSSDGTHFVRFPSVSLTPTGTQINGYDRAGAFGAIDTTDIDGLAGKYRAGYGTPFDLAVLRGRPGAEFLDFAHIGYVRVVDVIGSIDPMYATYDSMHNVINDPWPTPYAAGGFDLDAVAILNTVPEPGASVLLGLGAAGWLGARRMRRRR